MQNRSPCPGFFANNTGGAKGQDDCRINPLDIFSSSHSFKTTNSALDIKYNGPHVGVSPGKMTLRDAYLIEKLFLGW
jgi:hypothetical protein